MTQSNSIENSTSNRQVEQSTKGTTAMRQFIITVGSIAAAAAIACTASAAEAPSYAPNQQGEIDSMSAPRGGDLALIERMGVVAPVADNEALAAARGYDFTIAGSGVVDFGIDDLTLKLAGVVWPSDEEALTADRGVGLASGDPADVPAYSTVGGVASDTESMSAPRGHDLDALEVDEGVNFAMPSTFDDDAPRGPYLD